MVTSYPWEPPSIKNILLVLKHPKTETTTIKRITIVVPPDPISRIRDWLLLQILTAQTGGLANWRFEPLIWLLKATTNTPSQWTRIYKQFDLHKKKRMDSLAGNPCWKTAALEQKIFCKAYLMFGGVQTLFSTTPSAKVRELLPWKPARCRTNPWWWPVQAFGRFPRRLLCCGNKGQ